MKLDESKWFQTFDHDFKNKIINDAYLNKSIRYINVPTPDSRTVLPDPWLDLQKIRVNRFIERQIYKANSVKPGYYFKKEDIKNILWPAHDALISQVETIIRELDQFSLLIMLFDNLDVMYGVLSDEQQKTQALAYLKGNSDIGKGFVNEVLVRSRQTVGVRYLIGIAIKCGGKGNKQIEHDCFKELVALGARIGEIDFFLEYVMNDLGENQLTITDNFIAQTTQKKSWIRSLNSWEEATKNAQYDNYISQALGFQQIINQSIKIEDITQNNNWKIIDNAFKEELGYSLTEWLLISQSVVKYFDYYQRLLVVPKEEFICYIKIETKYGLGIIKSYFKDLTLSISNLEKISMEKMLPSEISKNGYEVRNCPILEVEEENKKYLLIGIETFENYFKLKNQEIFDGRLKASKLNPKGSIAKATGKLKEKAGNLFRDDLISRLKKLGIIGIPEKSNAGVVGLPEGVGPADVFVIDESHNRFIVVEAKDVSPKYDARGLKKQKEIFIGERNEVNDSFLYKLRKQVQWFSTNVEELKKEFKIKPEKVMKIEGVIVVNHAMMWLYFQKENLPIMDSYKFLDKVTNGGELYCI